MSYRVEFTDKAAKQLKKLNPYTAKLIISWLRKNLENCDNPRLHGKGLTGDKSGQWRYRIGDYRVLAEIQDSRVVILVLTVGHRRDVYEQ